MRATAAFSACVLIVSLLDQVSVYANLVGKYGETVEVPCNKRADIKLEDIRITKWKYTKVDGTVVDLLRKSHQNTTFVQNEEYNGRINLTNALSLQIFRAKMADQKTFTCMVVTDGDVFEYPVEVIIEKVPSPPTITNQSKVIELGKLTTLAACSAKDANPAASITWLKDNVPLVPVENVVKITPILETDKNTGLSTATSKLEYAATKADMNAKFTCAIQHKNLASDLVSSPMTFVVHYPSEKVSLQVLSALPIKEGDNVTLKCAADGNPPPTGYNFHIKEKKVTTENSDTYTLTGVSRADSGDYKCSLVDNEAKTGYASFIVMYLDITNSTKGKIVKNLTESFEAALLVNSSGKAEITWTKNNITLVSKPKFDKLKYSDSGMYECVVSMAGLVKKASFELRVQGAPVITTLNKLPRNEGKLLSCKAEGSPKPTVQWSINGTNASDSISADGTITYSLMVAPTGNVTVNCTVFNELGSATKSIDISTLPDDTTETTDKREDPEDSNNQAQVVVGVVLGVIVAALAVGLAYWIYMKRTREGSWKTGEKENGTLEESKKLEETQSQKADV